VLRLVLFVMLINIWEEGSVLVDKVFPIRKVSAKAGGKDLHKCFVFLNNWQEGKHKCNFLSAGEKQCA